MFKVDKISSKITIFNFSKFRDRKFKYFYKLQTILRNFPNWQSSIFVTVFKIFGFESCDFKQLGCDFRTILYCLHPWESIQHPKKRHTTVHVKTQTSASKQLSIGVWEEVRPKMGRLQYLNPYIVRLCKCFRIPLFNTSWENQSPSLLSPESPFGAPP